MKHETLLTDFREELSWLVRQVEGSVAMGHYDVNKISEGVICELIKLLSGLPNLRNLNAEEKQNFPAIDLADDEARMAVQVTSTADLKKIKTTLTSFLRYGLNDRYDRLLVYVLSSKQDSYSQQAIDRVLKGQFSFSVQDDVWDFRDLCSMAATVSPTLLSDSFAALRAYTRGVSAGLAEEDFDPPVEPKEELALNAIEVFFPNQLFIADLIPEIVKHKGRKNRQSVRGFLAELELTAPSDFEVRANQLITFHDLENDKGNPLLNVIDAGTVTPISAIEYAGIDLDNEKIFKSLLRFLLQQQLYRKRVFWRYEKGLFAFYPLEDEENIRTENWTGKRISSRKVFERRMNRDNPEKVLSTKHLAFSPQFLNLEERWFLAIIPDWFFSFGDDFKVSGFSDQQLSGIKRLERNRSVFDQFRFWSAWLRNCDSDDLFNVNLNQGPSLSYGDEVILAGAPSLDEKMWEPLADPSTDDVHPNPQRSFGSL